MRVVFPTALALLLCNMDRIVMSVAIVPMAAEYGWAPSIQVRLGPRPSHSKKKSKLCQNVGYDGLTPLSGFWVCCVMPRSRL